MGEQIDVAEEITEDAFEADALAFLKANATLRVEERRQWGQGSDRVGFFEEKTDAETKAEVSAAKTWRAKGFHPRFGWINGPRAYGGRAPPPPPYRILRRLAS